MTTACDGSCGRWNSDNTFKEHRAQSPGLRDARWLLATPAGIGLPLSGLRTVCTVDVRSTWSGEASGVGEIEYWRILILARLMRKSSNASPRATWSAQGA
jgi:hypothetical protein